MDKEGKKDEDKAEFDSAGEAIGYISLDQARVLALEHARHDQDFYGLLYARRELAWEELSAEESEDYYRIQLSYRPVRHFRGAPGVEQFTIDKAGPIRLRQILREPVERGPRPLLIPAGLVAALEVIAVVLVVLLTGGDEEAPASPRGPVSPQAVAVSSVRTVTVAVQPDAPAKLVSPSADVTVSLTAGSVEGPVELSYKPVEPQEVPPMPPGFVASEKVFDLSVTAAGASAASPVTLAKPVTLTIRLATGDVALAGGVGSNIVVQHFRDIDSKWDPLAEAVDGDRTLNDSSYPLWEPVLHEAGQLYLSLHCRYQRPVCTAAAVVL